MFFRTISAAGSQPSVDKRHIRELATVSLGGARRLGLVPRSARGREVASRHSPGARGRPPRLLGAVRDGPGRRWSRRTARAEQGTVKLTGIHSFSTRNQFEPTRQISDSGGMSISPDDRLQAGQIDGRGGHRCVAHGGRQRRQPGFGIGADPVPLWRTARNCRNSFSESRFDSTVWRLRPRVRGKVVGAVHRGGTEDPVPTSDVWMGRSPGPQRTNASSAA